jgi:hypothetical protein
VFAAYHQHGAVGVANYGIGDASHKGSPNSTAAAAAHDYQSRAYFFSHSHNLYVGVTFPEVSPHNFPPAFSISLACLLRSALASPPGGSGSGSV